MQESSQAHFAVAHALFEKPAADVHQADAEIRHELIEFDVDLIDEFFARNCSVHFSRSVR